jgi:hypothetical protein
MPRLVDVRSTAREDLNGASLGDRERFGRHGQVHHHRLGICPRPDGLVIRITIADPNVVTVAGFASPANASYGPGALRAPLVRGQARPAMPRRRRYARVAAARIMQVERPGLLEPIEDGDLPTVVSHRLGRPETWRVVPIRRWESAMKAMDGWFEGSASSRLSRTASGDPAQWQPCTAAEIVFRTGYPAGQQRLAGLLARAQ